MDIIRQIAVFGDSILKGIQLNPANEKYITDNHIDLDMLRNTYALAIENFSKFGCTITKGCEILKKRLSRGLECDIVVMDFGGNDCDFDWQAISENPEAEHQPHTPLDVFEQTYRSIIHMLREKAIRPILATLPPIDPQRFFDWFFRDLNKENILKWLGSVNTIYRYQENYSRTVEKIAREEDVYLVDLRGEFLKHRRIDNLLCGDGIHPNTEGQKLITTAFSNFARRALPRAELAALGI